MADEQQNVAEAAIEDSAPNLGDLYDKLTADGMEEEEPSKEEPSKEESEPESEGESSPARDEKGRFAAKDADGAQEAPEDEEAEDAEAEDDEGGKKDGPPSHLPRAVRERWADVPDDLRDPISAAHAEMSRKLADAGRRDQAIRPIYDSVVKAAQDIPAMADMQPQQIADAVFELAKVQHRMNTDPVNTFMSIAQRYGVLPVLQQMAAGQKPTHQAQNEQQLMQHIGRLEQEVQRLSDPAHVEGIIDQRFSERSVTDEVSRFAQQAEHWDEVEDILPDFVPLAQKLLGDGASHADVLKRAYTMATNERGLKVTPPKADPKRTESVKKAKSLNVPSRSTGKSRTKTEHEILSDKYDEIMGA